MAAFIERDERCLFIGNLDTRVTEEILWELFLQAGPLEAVHIPKDKETGRQKSYGFVSFSHEVSVPYTISLLNGISLYGRAINVKTAQQNTGTNSPGNQSPSSVSSPLFDSPNGQSNLHPSNYSRGVSNNSPLSRLGSEIWNRLSTPNSTPRPLMISPSPSRNEIDNNLHSRYPLARNRWDQMSPWQQNEGRDYNGRPMSRWDQMSPSQPGRSPNPQFLPRGQRHFRPDFS
ncbi:hypothetical protein ACROYT_G029521 [Oculina patagonica]